MMFLYRRRCYLSPPGWTLTQRRSLSLLVVISREWMTDSINPSFTPWRRCSAQNSAPRWLDISSCRWSECEYNAVFKQANLASTGISPDPAASVGIWLPSYTLLRLRGCSGTPGALAGYPLLVGQPAYSWWSDQLPGLQKRPGTSRLSLTYTSADLMNSGAFYWAYYFFFAEGFFVCGLNLTADRHYITKSPKQSLRTLTFSNWETLQKWVEEQKPGSDPKSLNIIAGDFVGPLPLCSLVLALNQKLLQKDY